MQLSDRFDKPRCDECAMIVRYTVTINVNISPQSLQQAIGDGSGWSGRGW